MKHHRFLPVFLALVAFYIGLHFYAARWLSKSFGLGPAAAYRLRMALLAAAFLSPLTMFLKRQYHAPPLEAVYAAGYVWMGVILIATFVFFCSDLAAFALRRSGLPAAPPHLPPLALASLAAILAWALYGGLRTPAVNEIPVQVKNLPAPLDGLRIAQISDIHVDSAWKLRQFNGIVERVNAARPDLVLITGDLIDPGMTCREGLGEAALRLKSRLGTYGSLGNHEYYYGLDKAIDCYRAFGIKLLKNEALNLEGLKLIGLGDIHTENISAPEVRALLERNRDGKFTVIMTHQPLYYKEISETGNYLVLSGHTHRGQLFPFHLFTRLFYKYFYGLYRINGSAFYVTSGAGTWGPPLRWLAPAEIPVITLTAAKRP